MPEQLKMKVGRTVPPVVDHPRLARMTDKKPRPRPIGGKILVMAENPKPDTGKERRMAPVRKVTGGRPPSVRPDQVPPKSRPQTSGQPEGYVRIRLRVRDGDMAVVGAKAVEGPLIESKLQGDLAYEVTLGRKRLAAGAVPDVGEQRSFPDPQGTPEQQGHHVTPLETYEVNVRVPKDQISEASLPRVEIALYRMKEPLPLERLAPGEIGTQFPRELREVARMKGIRPDQLSGTVAAQLRDALR